MKKQNSLEKQLYKLGIYALIVGGFIILVHQFIWVKYLNLPCAMDFFFHLYCPGCGGTRAVKELLQGHLLKSLWYHPLVLYTLFIYGGFMISHTLSILNRGKTKGWRFHSWYLYGALFLMILNFLLKNILRIFFYIEML